METKEVSVTEFNFHPFVLIVLTPIVPFYIHVIIQFRINYF